MTEIHSSIPEIPERPLGATAVPDGTYIAEPAGSTLRFKAKAFTLFWVRGSMPAVAGTLHIRDGKLSGTGTIAADRVDTGVGARDWHLRSSHYLHAKRHPAITLSVEDADLAARTADCTVTVRDTSSVVPMTITSLECHEGRLRLEASVELDRTVFPMLPPAAGVSRKVQIELTVVAARR
jgi:polyisoprenoid-binding protein YceI